MGSGKTKYGKKIARMMGYSFYDVDHYIEGKAGMTVAEIFAEKGEKWFRIAETEAITELSEKENAVISTGGGLPCQGNNMELLNQYGLTVYLKLTTSELYENLKSSKKERPLLAGKSKKEMKQTIKAMLKEREPFYNQADMTLESMHRVTESVVNSIQRKKKST